MSGPHTVLQQISPVNVRIQSDETGTVQTVHVLRLRLFVPRISSLALEHTRKEVEPPVFREQRLPEIASGEEGSNPQILEQRVLENGTVQYLIQRRPPPFPPQWVSRESVNPRERGF